MAYSENFKIEAKRVLSTSYILERILDEGDEIIGVWIEDELNCAKNDLDKVRYQKLNNLYGMWLLERRA